MLNRPFFFFRGTWRDERSFSKDIAVFGVVGDGDDVFRAFKGYGMVAHDLAFADGFDIRDLDSRGGLHDFGQRFRRA